VAGQTAAAALAAIDPRPGDTVLIGGAAGGVGVFAVQLAKLTGARVLGTASAKAPKLCGRRSPTRCLRKSLSATAAGAGLSRFEKCAC
jgi:NADPH:quinone reductase-like Zn-dependent oxidoreductase